MEDFFSIDGYKIVFSNIEETLGMGGPWVGELSIDTTKVEGIFIVQKPLIHKQKLFFIKMNVHGKWRRNINFTILVFDLQQKQYLESKGTYSFIVIDSISDEDEIIFYDSLDKTFGNKFIIKLDSIFFK